MPPPAMATATEHGAYSARGTADSTSAVTATEHGPQEQTVNILYDLLLFLSDVFGDACNLSPD